MVFPLGLGSHYSGPSNLPGALHRRGRCGAGGGGMPEALLRQFAAADFLDRGRPWAALIGEETGMMKNAVAGIEPLTRFDGRLLKGSTPPSGAVPGVEPQRRPCATQANDVKESEMRKAASAMAMAAMIFSSVATVARAEDPHAKQHARQAEMEKCILGETRKGFGPGEAYSNCQGMSVVTAPSIPSPMSEMDMCVESEINKGAISKAEAKKVCAGYLHNPNQNPGPVYPPTPSVPAPAAPEPAQPEVPNPETDFVACLNLHIGTAMKSGATSSEAQRKAYNVCKHL